MLTYRDLYEIISSPITSITSHLTHLAFTFSPSTTSSSASPTLSLPYAAIFPSRLTPTPDACPLLTPSLLQAELSPMGAIPIPSAADLEPAKFPPRIGEDPRTLTKGLFWAGNSGSPMANVNLAVQQGQTAAAWAAEELGSEDVEMLRAGEL